MANEPTAGPTVSDDAPELLARAPEEWRLAWVRSPWLPWIHGCAVRLGDDLLGVAWSPTRRHAVVRAMGEAFERAALAGTGIRTVTATAAELGGRALDLASTLTFEQHQLRSDAFSLFRWTATTRTSWVDAERASARGNVLVPADLAYLRTELADRLRVRPVSSTGTALAATWEEAVSAAAAELVERHELAVGVAGGFPARGFVPAGHGIEELTDQLRENGVTVRLGLVSERHGLSTVVALLHGGHVAQPAVAAGSAAAACPVRAARSAVLEAIGSWHLAAQAARRRPRRATRSPRNAVERASWWASPAAAALHTWVVDDGTERVSDCCGNAVPAADPLRSLSDEGHGIAVLDITPPAVAGAFRVARLVAPAAALLHADERYSLSPAVRSRYPALTRGPIVRPHPFV